MDLFIARQPIFTVQKRLFAYELLYRGTKSRSLDNTSGNKATTSVLSSVFLTEGVDKISGSKPCFINFTRDLLLQNLPASFPKNRVVIEILEDIAATEDIVEVCRQLKNEGYTIALDDFIYDHSLEPLIELADIIKFDFRLTPLETIHKALHYLSKFKLKFLAEKVETYEEFFKAAKLGFSYFQGYFFCKPENMHIREIDSAKINLVSLLAEVNKKKTTVKSLARIIERDVALTYKLMKYVNSSYFSRVSKIESVEKAIAYLGANELRRYVILILISELASDKPSELLRLALVRAEMCRQLALNSALTENCDEIFLLGLFSLLDAMLDTSQDYICEQLAFGDNLTNALTGRTGPFAPFIDTVIYYERGRNQQCIKASESIGFDPSNLQQLYLEAIGFVQSILD